MVVCRYIAFWTRVRYSSSPPIHHASLLIIVLTLPVASFYLYWKKRLSLLSLLQPWTKYAQRSPNFLIRLSFVIYSEELRRQWLIFFFWVFSQNFLDYTILSLKYSPFVSLLCMHTSSKSTSPFATTPNNISHNEPNFSSFSLSDYESIWYFFTESYSISDDTTL